MDVVDAETRSRMMSGIRGKNTKPELVVRRALLAANYSYRLHRAELPGRPDIVVPRSGAAILVHGCFWHAHHGCRFAKMPATRSEFWRDKLRANCERDADHSALLNLLGWRVLIVWECATRAKGAGALQTLLSGWLEGNSDYGEIGETDSRYKELTTTDEAAR